MNRGTVPVGPFARVIKEWLIAQETDLEQLVSPMVRLANMMGRDVNNVRKIVNGKRPHIGFDIADKIVTVCTDGFGWIEDPELQEIYQSFDLSWLDRRSPCVGVA